MRHVKLVEIDGKRQFRQAEGGGFRRRQAVVRQGLADDVDAFRRQRLDAEAAEQQRRAAPVQLGIADAEPYALTVGDGDRADRGFRRQDAAEARNRDTAVGRGKLVLHEGQEIGLLLLRLRRTAALTSRLPGRLRGILRKSLRDRRDGRPHERFPCTRHGEQAGHGGEDQESGDGEKSGQNACPMPT